MNLELTARERTLLFESLVNRIHRIEELKESYVDVPDLFEYYAQQEADVKLLLGKVKIYL
jgi:hypothetical protein